MLVLTRRIGEVLKIGKDVSLTVIEIRGRQVRVGIEAPDAIVVTRGESISRAEREVGPSAPDSKPAGT
jgi:carbon storage regulator